MQTQSGDAAAWAGNQDIEIADPEILALMKREKARQKRCLEMIASENFTSKAVLQALGSSFTNKYSEGQVGQRLVQELHEELEHGFLCDKLGFFNLLC